jgi:hypothetical protein
MQQVMCAQPKAGDVFFFLEGTIFSVFSFFYLSKYQKINARQQEKIGFNPAWHTEARLEPGCEGKC